jgi:hypothetical protein
MSDQLQAYSWYSQTGSKKPDGVSAVPGVYRLSHGRTQRVESRPFGKGMTHVHTAEENRTMKKK